MDASLIIKNFRGHDVIVYDIFIGRTGPDVKGYAGYAVYQVIGKEINGRYLIKETLDGTPCPAKGQGRFDVIDIADNAKQAESKLVKYARLHVEGLKDWMGFPIKDLTGKVMTANIGKGNPRKQIF